MPAFTDFDGDEDFDIFTMDQEDHLILPEGAPVSAYLRENIDDMGAQFRERIVPDKYTGGQDVTFSNVDGDGDPDAYFKVWANYRENGYGAKAHVVCLENLTVQ